MVVVIFVEETTGLPYLGYDPNLSKVEIRRRLNLINFQLIRLFFQKVAVDKILSNFEYFEFTCWYINTNYEFNKVKLHAMCAIFPLKTNPKFNQPE